MLNMSYLELAQSFKGHKSGRHIAKVLLKNAKKKGVAATTPFRYK